MTVHIKGVPDDMIANNLKPFYNVHPGGILKDELEYRGISEQAMADKIGIPCEQLHEMLECRAPLTAEMGLLLGAALDINPEPLLQIQLEYDLRAKRESKGFMARLDKLRRVAAVL